MIPTAALPHRVTLEAHVGQAGAGAPTFGAPVRHIPARVLRKGTQVRSAEGTITLTSAAIQTRPISGALAPQSRITDERTGDRYELVEHRQEHEGRRRWCDLLLVDGPRSVGYDDPDVPGAGPDPEPEP